MKNLQRAGALLVFAIGAYATVGCSIPEGWKNKCGSSTGVCPTPTATVPNGAPVMRRACCEDPGYAGWLATDNFPSGECLAYGGVTGLMCTFLNPKDAPPGSEYSVCNMTITPGWVVTNASAFAGSCHNNAGLLSAKQTLKKLTDLPVGTTVTACSAGPSVIPIGWTLVSSTTSSDVCPAIYGSHVYRRDF